MSDLSASPLSTAPEFAPESEWGAVLTIRFPDGTMRHPRLLGVVEQSLGRFCLPVLNDEGIKVVYGLDSPTRQKAEQQSLDIVASLLELLGLDDSSVHEHRVHSMSPTQPAPGPTAPRLRLVPLPDES